MCSRLVGVQVAGVRVRAESDDLIFFLIIFFFFFLIFEGIFLIVVAAAAAASWLSVAWMFVSFVQTLHVPRGGEKGTPTRCPSEHQPISFHCL